MSEDTISIIREKYHGVLRPLYNRKLGLEFTGIADWFLFSLFVLPTYFGVRLGFFDLTAFRLFEIFLLICIYRNRERHENFVRLVRRCPNTIFIAAYFFVVVYTNLMHPSLNTIFYWLMNGVLALFCVAYLIIYEYGINKFLDRLRAYSWILAVVSPMELIIGKTPFSFLDTLGKSRVTTRFGEVRIMGNCTTTNGYAMYLMILFPIMCYDWENKKVDLNKNKWLLMLMALNIFLTGSRLTIGTLILGFVLCFIMQEKERIKKALIALAIIAPIAAFLLFMLQNVSFVQSLLCTLFSAVDEVLGTSYAVNFGANATTLYNSSYYRELLWKNTILGDWLNPWLGQGGNYNFGMYIDGYSIFSCDNYYVGQYITYAWPGVVTWLIMSASFFVQSIKKWFKQKDGLSWVIIVSVLCYFISLWYLDQLQTFPIMMAVFGLIYAYKKEGVENYDS